MSADRDARIRQRAFEIWERENRPEGRDQVHWTLAEAEIDAENRRIVGDQEVTATVPARTRRPAPGTAQSDKEGVLKRVGRRYVETISDVVGAATNAAVDALEEALPKPTRRRSKASSPADGGTVQEMAAERPAIRVRPAKATRGRRKAE